MHWTEIGQALILITVANGAPVIVKRILGERCSQPLDAGILWRDRRAAFGPSKTFRGLIASVLTTALIAPIFRVGWIVGLAVGLAAMAGDLLSSFLKRRLGIPPSARATGLDQIPESLFPGLVCMPALDLNWTDVLVISCVFFAGEIVLSCILYALHIRARPY
jgi:hypothetical protein